MGKLFERMIATRMWTEVDRTGSLADAQFGFRPERSTIGALQMVQQKGEEISTLPLRRKGFCVLVTLDVRNAFNMTPWRGVVDEIKRRRMALYLIKLIFSYLDERTLIIGN